MNYRNLPGQSQEYLAPFIIAKTMRLVNTR